MSTISFHNVVGGKQVAAADGGTYDVIDPTTGEAYATAAASGAEDVDRAFAAAATAFDSWGTTTPSQRQRALLKIADALEDRAEEFVRVESKDTGKPLGLTSSEELPPAVDQIRFFAGAARVLEGKSAGEYLTDYTSWVRREPIGVVAQVTPWNYPLMMMVWKIAPALAAGNTIVLKPSDTTPASSVLLAELAAEFLPDGVLNVVTGNRDTGRLLVEHPTPQLVAITGSVRAGREVAASAAANLKRVHLELGGKAPVVVFDDADVAAAAQGIAEAGYFNAGQDCTAATRVLAGPRVHNDFVAALTERARGTSTGLPVRILLIGAGGVGSAFAAIAARRDFFETIVVTDYDHERSRPGGGHGRSIRGGSPARRLLVAVDHPAVPGIPDHPRDECGRSTLRDADLRRRLRGGGRLPRHGHEPVPVGIPSSRTSGWASSWATNSLPRPTPGSTRIGWLWSGWAWSRASPTSSRATPPTNCSTDVEEFGVRDGANLVVTDEQGNELFAPSFSIWTTIEECLNPPVIYESARAETDGGWFTTPPFSEPETFDFPEGIGPVECVNVEHEEVLLMPRFLDCDRATFKYGLGEEFIGVLRTLHTLGLDSTTPVRVGGVQVAPRDVVAARLPDPATIGPQMTGKTCAGLWVKGTGKDGRPRSTYLYHVVDNQWAMAEYGHQCVVWQTAINPVVALEFARLR